MTIDFSNTSNADHSSVSKADMVESAFDGAVHSEVSSVEQKSILFDTMHPSSQLSRQKRQYDPSDINIAKLFTAIREHKTGNPPKDKIAKIKRLLTQIRNINDVDANDHNNTPLHVAVSKGHHDIVDLLLKVPNININIKNKQGNTPLDLANDLSSSHANKKDIIIQLEARRAQPGSSDSLQPMPTPANRVVLLKTWYTEEQLRNYPNLLFLFDDNDNAKYRMDRTNPGGGGQASVTRPTGAGKQPYDRLPNNGGINGNAIGITTTFCGGYTPNINEFKALMDKEFAPIETWVKKGGFVAIPCSNNDKPSLGTGIAGLESKILGALDYIQSKVDKLVTLGKNVIQDPQDEDFNTLKQELHETLLAERQSYQSKGLAGYLGSSTGQRMDVDQPSNSGKQQSSVLKLPENFEIGKAITNGDCFFDSFRQGLEQLGIKVSVEQLRGICKEFAQNNPLKWFIDAIANSRNQDNSVRSEIPSKYAENIMDHNRWGDPDIEGRILCQKYSVELHVGEDHPNVGWIHQIIDGTGSRSISEDEVDYDAVNTIHIVNGGRNHFEPILRSDNQQSRIPRPNPDGDLNPNRSRLGQLPPPQSNARETYRASGLKHSLHGNIYQLKLLMLFLNRGLKEGYDFRLATEWDDAEKFDDLVFKYTDQGQDKYRFLQAKHKQDESKKIGIGDLFTEQKGGGEFELTKYFLSYLKIKNNPIFQGGDLVDFIICTNIGFDLDNSSPTQLKVIKSGKNKGKKISVEEIKGNDVFFKDGGQRYQLKDSQGDLATHLKQSEEIKKQNMQNIDVEINNFLEKLVFAVAQPNEIELSKIIGKELGEEFNLIDADLVIDNFQKEMLNWMKEKGPKGKEGRFLTSEDGKEFFGFAKQKVSKLKIAGPTSGYSEKLKRYNIKFKPDKLTEVESFLGQSQKQILNLKFQHDTRLSAIKVNQAVENHNSYKAEDSYIFLSLGGLLRLKDKALNAFKAQNTGNLLVIECKSNGADDIQALSSELIRIATNTPNKKIILITQDDNALANAFKNDGQIGNKYDEKSDDIGGLSDLTPESQKKMLDKTVNFQGNDTPLGKLINDNQKNLVDGEVLAQLVDGEEIKIGNTVPGLTGIDKECYIERTFGKGEEHNIRSITDKVAIIAAKPGMGKSVVLTHLAEQEKISDPSLWVVKINLIEHVQALNTEIFDNYNKEKAINFLSRIIGLNTPLEKELFQNRFNQQDKVALFFNGFDEVSLTYKDKVIKLLTILKETQVKKLWVTTRTHMCDKLENALGVSSYELKPLSRNEQKEFLKKFFGSNLETQSISVDEGRLEICTQTFLNAFANDLSLGQDFTAVPLQLKMVAEYLQDNFKKFYDSDKNIFSLPDNFNLIDLYEKFIKCKFDKYSRKQESHKNPSDRLSFNEFFKQRQLLALDVLFEEELNNLLSKKQIDKIESLKEQMKEGNGYVGVIDSIVDEKPNFTHLTFAEYLAAQKLFNMFTRQQEKIDSDYDKEYIEGLKSKQETLREFLLEHFLLQDNIIGVKQFFDNIAAKDSILHTTFLSDTNKVKGMLSDPDININTQDALGRTILHLAASWKDVDFIKILIANSNTDLTKKDNLFELAPINYSNDVIVIEKILEKILNPNYVEIRVVEDMMLSDNLIQKDTFFNKIIQEECITLLKNIVYKYPVVINYRFESEFENGDSILHRAIRFSTIEIITYLISNDADPNAVNNEEMTPIDLALQGLHKDESKFKKIVELIARAMAGNNDERYGEIIRESALKRKNQIQLTSEEIINIFFPNDEPSAKRRRLENPSCSKNRKKRAVGMKCVDSRDEEEIDKVEKRKLIQEIFRSREMKEMLSKIMSMLKKYGIANDNNVQQYKELLEVSSRISSNQATDSDIQEFSTKIKALGFINSEAEDAIKEIQEKNIEGIREVIGRPGVLENINKRVSWVIRGQMYGNIIGNIADGNVEGALAGSAVIAGDYAFGKVTGIAPVTWYFMVKSLADDIEKLKAGEDVAVEIALDSTVLAGSFLQSAAPMLASEYAIELGPEAEILVGAAMAIKIVYVAVKDVMHEKETIHLTGEQTVEAIVRRILNLSPSKQERELIEEEAANNILAKEGLNFLMQHPEIKSYVFSTGMPEKYDCKKRTVPLPGSKCNANAGKCMEEIEECKTRIKEEMNSIVLLSSKRSNVMWSRARINNPYLGGEERCVTQMVPRSDCNSNAMSQSCLEPKKYCKIINQNVGELFCHPGKLGEARNRRDLSGAGAAYRELHISNDNREDPHYERVSHPAYYCGNAIGLSYVQDRTGNYTLINLGDSDDKAIGFLDSPNIFLIGNGNKTFFGGNKDDVFILRNNGITGTLNGGGGNNTLDLTNFAPNEHETIILNYIDPEVGEMVYKRSDQKFFTIKNMHTILGREKKKDRILPSCNVKVIDGQGGESDSNPDEIIIHSCILREPLQIVVKPYTKVHNDDIFNNFSHIIPVGRGNVHINMTGESGFRSSNTKHEFFFGYTLSDLMNIVTSNTRNTYNYVANCMIRNIALSFLSPKTGRNFANERSNTTIVGISDDDTPYLQDNAIVKIDRYENVYVIQNADKSVDEVVRSYPQIADRLNATITVKSGNQCIVVGHGAHEIFYSNPTCENHLIGNGGENTYVIASPSEQQSNNIPKVNVYNVNEKNSVDSLDLHNAIKASEKYLTKKYNDSLSAIEISHNADVFQDENNLLILLKVKIIELESKGFRNSNVIIGPYEKSIITVKLVNGTQWYQKLHVYLNDTIPMQLESTGENWKLSPILNLEGVKVIPIDIFRYYKPNNEQGLQIYHNQPQNKHQIGIVDLKDKSILNCDMRVIGSSLTLSFKGSTIVKVENWLGSPEAREMIFTFSDALISNAKCVISICDPHDIIAEFKQEKSKVSNLENTTPHPIRRRRHKHHHRGNNRHRRAVEVEDVTNAKGSLERAEILAAKSSGTKPKSWINEGVVWMKESITNAYETTMDVISGLFSKDKTSQKMESATRFEDIKTWNKENNEPFNGNVEEETSQNVVGFYDAVLGKLNKEDLKRIEDLCEEIKANFEPYKDSDIYTCLRNVAELIKDKCNIDNDYLNNLCANKLLESMKEQTDNVKRYNMQKQGEYIRNLYDQDRNIILLTYLLGWYNKIKSKDEEDIHDEIREVAYRVLKEVKACETITELSIPIVITEDDIYTATLGKMIISGNIQKNQIVETLFCSLENLIEIKLKEDKNKEESSKIKEFMETYKTNVIIALGTVADNIINYYNAKFSGEEKYYYNKPCTAIKPNSTLEEIQSAYETVLSNVPSDRDIVLPKLFGNSLSLIDTNKPTSSLHDISVMSSNITQVRSF
ncbi:ankyrin repeat domain-containing protein [Candidatus Mesenet endosymbiont of Agriotes lineatus]|uniref:ankyrin repeat domain-containing protein n=1 Tax=Candidatus Mesenet endosymbiont of Agriotes lineatus TaxID=3077948 RepID=UPI0030CF4FE3